jgi:alpha/beta superfamily hydrolase
MMHTKALYHLTRTLNALGFSTLRFNFRGVGTSTGEYDGGQGEKEDARRALSALKSRLDGGSLLVGGFSFGAAIGLNVGSDDSEVNGLVGIGLPLSLVDFTYLNSEERPLLIVQGTEDQFGSPDLLKSTINLERTNVRCQFIQGSPHLFTGYFEDLRAAVREFYEGGPGQKLIGGATSASESDS